ncbi:MAG: PIN domain-containing protein [Nanoarchaeota archaeon]
MNRSFYFDTSIWLDFLENRDEPNFPKSKWAKKLVENIILEDDILLISDLNLIELEHLGYSIYIFDEMIQKFGDRFVKVEAGEDELGRARDLANKRNIPRNDAIHALIARTNRAILITLDRHFNEIKDICIPHSPREFAF